MKLDIENKILIPFLLLIIIPILMVGGVFYWNSSQLFVESQKKTMAKDLDNVVIYLDLLSDDVKRGNLSGKQAQDQALYYLTKSWKEIIVVYDKNQGYLLTGSELTVPSLLGSEKGVRFENSKSQLSAYVQYPKWNWVIGMSYDTKQFAYQLLDLQKYTMLIAIIGIIVAVELSIFLAHNISRPIKRLAEICNNISMGNLDNRMPPDRKDEIGILARALHNMLLRLQENNREMEEMKKSNEDILRCIDIGIIAINKAG